MHLLLAFGVDDLVCLELVVRRVRKTSDPRSQGSSRHPIQSSDLGERVLQLPTKLPDPTEILESPSRLHPNAQV